MWLVTKSRLPWPSGGQHYSKCCPTPIQINIKTKQRFKQKHGRVCLCGDSTTASAAPKTTGVHSLLNSLLQPSPTNHRDASVIGSQHSDEKSSTWKQLHTQAHSHAHTYTLLPHSDTKPTYTHSHTILSPVTNVGWWPKTCHF